MIPIGVRLQHRQAPLQSDHEPRHALGHLLQMRRRVLRGCVALGLRRPWGTCARRLLHPRGPGRQRHHVVEHGA
eukprot:2808419-Pyramimonas_sp.AAC.1